MARWPLRRTKGRAVKSTMEALSAARCPRPAPCDQRPEAAILEANIVRFQVSQGGASENENEGFRLENLAFLAGSFLDLFERRTRILFHPSPGQCLMKARIQVAAEAWRTRITPLRRDLALFKSEMR